MLNDSDEREDDKAEPENVKDNLVEFPRNGRVVTIGLPDTLEGVLEMLPFAAGVGREKIAFDEDTEKVLVGVLIGYLFDEGN